MWKRKEKNKEVSACVCFLTLKEAPSTSTALRSFLFFDEKDDDDDDDDDTTVGMVLPSLAATPDANNSPPVVALEDDDDNASVLDVAAAVVISDDDDDDAALLLPLPLLLPPVVCSMKALPEASLSMSLCRCEETSHWDHRSPSRVFTRRPFIVSCMCSRNERVWVNRHCQKT